VESILAALKNRLAGGEIIEESVISGESIPREANNEHNQVFTKNNGPRFLAALVRRN
jgi:hypothetical protein